MLPRVKFIAIYHRELVAGGFDFEGNVMFNSKCKSRFTNQSSKLAKQTYTTGRYCGTKVLGHEIG
jgi:hypothetical protein